MKALYLSLLFLLLSCGDDSFKKVEALGEFRILGVVATPAEVAPNGTSNLQVIISDANGGGRPITATYQSCVDPGISYGAQVSCDHDPSSTPIVYTLLGGDEDFNDPNLAYTGVTPTLSITVPSTIFAGRSAVEQFNGVAYIVIFKFTVGGEEFKTFKRIPAVAGRPVNTNPTVSSVSVNGSAIAAFPQDGDSLLAVSNSPETYQYITTDNVTETRTENLQVAWYTSSGEFSLSKTYTDEPTEFKGSAPTGDSVILALVRDERGGLGFFRFSP
jgi:hypothetical protein